VTATETASAPRVEGGRALEIAELTKRFGGNTAVDGLTLDVPEGSIFGLIGPNGAGKTTVVNMITGYMQPDRGRIAFRGDDVVGLKPHRLAGAGLARTYQNLRLFEGFTVLENVLTGRHRSFTAPFWKIGWADRREEKAQTAKALELIERVGLQDYAKVDVTGLPYGLRRRVEIARALAVEPTLVLLDEPTAGMTRAESDEMGRLMQKVNSEGVTVFLIEHNVRLVSAVCTEIAVLDWGRLIARGRPSEVWELEQVQTAYLGHKTGDGDAPRG
jgi:ABC-type branched-subunit amino acid transport system ATPase component